ncbi:hypothetical protein [Porphyromonas circumdentaria]|uniref:Uncharacterized protein n=1 Tax=Porphyromonas circumdentaria TaxID=29524 RepID=A0A1T4LSE9_9PORP|nr:hypothetical protein [Porphyromonas circumdentaria]MBB6275450.1 uncharacterized membrane protein YhaH (DUF805 family) [Porphyromonas circumdentaria]SJZ57652.1 hypothetical protein SAMN02745171_00514 [Porphyromonas circumdentaria]
MKRMYWIIMLIAIVLIIAVVVGAVIAFLYLPESMQGVVLGVGALALFNLVLVLGFTRYNGRRRNRRR